MTVVETGGVRKIRWALAGRGKRGGARVIYFYHEERMPAGDGTPAVSVSRGQDLAPRWASRGQLQ